MHVTDFTAFDKRSQQIGQTPLVPIQLIIQQRPHTIYLKLEGANPTGSMKDRTGYALISSLEEQQVLHTDAVIVESTSGNLGAALALQCRVRGYRFIAVVDPKTTQENIQKMQALGAEVDVVRQPDINASYLLSRLAHVQKLCDQHRNYIWTNQYASPANPAIHYRSTGPEIYRQKQGEIGAIFIPVSTGGTLAGIGRFLRESSPATRVIGVDAYGSVIFGTPAASRKLTGIGSSRPSTFLSPDLYDMHMLARDEEAFAFCRKLYTATQISVGGSSGATLAACARYLKAYPETTHIVCVCADRGENYSSTIFNDEWLHRETQTLSQEHLRDVEIVPDSSFVKADNAH